MNRRAIPEAAAESRWEASDGWSLRRIDWRVAENPRGSILFLPGRGDIYEKYLETMAHFHAQGWNVTSSDWRGQGGAGRMSDNPYVGHIEDFSIWVDDYVELASRWKSEFPGPYVVMGHSMGGHLVARALLERRVEADAAVLIAPMLGLHGMGLPVAFGHFVAKVMRLLGRPERPAWKVSEKPASPAAIRQSLLTHDDERYLDEAWWWGQRPELVMGPASWHWVERAYQSVRSINAPGTWEGLATPILLLGTTVDQLVSYPAIAGAARRLPDAELKTFGAECAHEILREVDSVRDEALQTIDDFLGRKAPANP